MKAVVLAGGLGTRLRPYTFSVPKPLLPLRDRPLLDYILAQLARSGVTEAVLALGYHAELIKAYCGDGSKFGLRTHYVEESEPLGTAGPLALARPYLDDDAPFVVTNGDIVTKLDFRRLAAFHRDHDATLTIGYRTHTWTSPFGVLQLDGDVVTGIVEKPSTTHPVSAGIYCVSPAAFRYLAKPRAITMPELALAIRKDGGTVAACEITEFWRALETPDHFEELMNADEDLPAVP